ncbi:MAG: BsuPI-related putative proteinase inhibitor [Candidatus Eremiobacteraeota bacterium]|nr:BsuPI-related putative proteinase inhibitor [Candidatus Eremiobacteraeota bacterium]
MKFLHILSAMVILGLVGSSARAAVNPLSLRIELSRHSLDLLDVLTASIIVQNTSAKTVRASFPNTDTYDIELIRDDKVVWSYDRTHNPIAIKRVLYFSPGRTVLVRHDWNQTLLDGRSIAPGLYLLRVSLRDDTHRPQAQTSVRFAQPLPVSALAKIAPTDEVTVEGRLVASTLGMKLVDSSGKIALSHAIATTQPGGTFIVRGYVQSSADGATFTIDRWARGYDNPLR